MSFLTAHWTEILGVLGFVMAAAHTIVKLTPSTKDDEIEQKVADALRGLGVKIPNA